MATVKGLGLNTKGIRGEFYEALNAAPSFYGRFCSSLPSDADQETYKFLGGTVQPVEFKDSRLAQGLVSYSYNVKNTTYEATLDIDREELEDDQTGQIMLRVGEMGESWNPFKDYLLTQLIENGGSSGYNSYDGVTFFNDAHLVKKYDGTTAGTTDNNMTGAATTGTAPTQAEFQAAFVQMVAQIRGFKDEQGRPQNLIGPGQLVVMVHPGDELVARQTLQAGIIGTNTNILANQAEVFVNPWLTGVDTTYVMVMGSRIGPFIYQERTAPELVILDSPEYQAEHNKIRVLARQRFRISYGRFFRCVRWVWT